VSTHVIDPLSLMFGSAASAAMAAKKRLQDGTFAGDRVSEYAIDIPLLGAGAGTAAPGAPRGVVRRGPVGSLPPIPHSYRGVFAAAGSGALAGIQTSQLVGGWWDNTASGGGGDGPEMELQAIHEEARSRLTRTVLATLKSAFKTYAPEEGMEAEAAQDLLAAVAEESTKEWLLASRGAVAAAVAAGGVMKEADSEEDAVDMEMVRRAGDLAAALIVLDDVESPGSKSALYLNLLSHMASLSRASEAAGAAIEAAETAETAETAVTAEMCAAPVVDGEMVEAAIELAASAAEREDVGLSFSMAAVTVSVLEDAMLRVSEAVASAYLSRVREGASAPAVTRASKKLAAAATARGGKKVSRVEQARAARRTAMLAASSASQVVRYALQLQPRLKSTRSLEKFRNEVKLQGWLETNYHDVVAMYEDWHKLMGVDEAGDIVTRRISICRHSELDQVKGLRLVMSLFLEVADVVVPVARAALNNLQKFTSWLLVTLIGRSLGLVYRGIRESMGGGNNDSKPRFA